MEYVAEMEIRGFADTKCAPSLVSENRQIRRPGDLPAIYEAHRDRVYGLAFWMTDNELTAEEISVRVFARAFRRPGIANADSIDRILVQEFRDLTSIGQLTLEGTVATRRGIAGNTRRIHLERAVVQLPSTERLAFLLHDGEGYEHERIAKLLGITVDESQRAVLFARIQIRELVATMI